jgi:hypothetical protein
MGGTGFPGESNMDGDLPEVNKRTRGDIKYPKGAAK